MNCPELLEKTSAITNEVSQKHKEQGDFFNIFYILKKEKDEAHSHCLFIYELLNPNGKHFQGDIFLKLFFEIVLSKPYEDKSIVVLREFAFDKNNRLDFLIKSNSFCYPIEVKIYASEGMGNSEESGQIERYCNWAKSVSDNPTVFFLTLDGKESVSVSEANRKMVQTISFKEHIVKWLLACMNHIKNNVSLYECIKQYYRVIERLTDDMYQDEKKEILNLIYTSSKNVKSATLISDALTIAKAEKIKEIFSVIERHIGNRIGKIIDRSYINKADNNKPNPALSYLLFEKNDCCLALRFEIAWRLFFGVAYYRKDSNGNWNQVKYSDIKNIACFSNEEIEKFRCVKMDTAENWFDWWLFLPDKENKIDFKNCNDTYYNLFDAEFFENIKNEIIIRIDSELESINLI